MLAIFRNPLLVLLRRLWWVIPLASLAAWAVWGRGGLDTLITVLFVCLTFLLVPVGFIGLRGLQLAAREDLRHLDAGHRFLCPHCLLFGDYAFACGACGKELEGFLVYTEGAYVNTCRHCQSAVLSREGQKGKGAAAFCGGCGGVGDPTVYHERQVRVLGALTGAGLASFCDANPARAWSGHGDYACADDGTRLTYVLNLEKILEDASSPPAPHTFHALFGMEALWLGETDLEPLALGQRLDRFLRLPQHVKGFRRELPVCVVGSPEPEAAMRNVLEARFSNVRYGVSPGEFLWRGSNAPTCPDGKSEDGAASG
jgi:hypothetical protein